MDTSDPVMNTETTNSLVHDLRNDVLVANLAPRIHALGHHAPAALLGTVPLQKASSKCSEEMVGKRACLV
jgi:hypothetical protein